MKYSLLLTFFTLIASSAAEAQEISLFNGRDLSGWKGMPEYWSVQNGNITGRVTANNLPSSQTDLVWQGGLVSDFEWPRNFYSVKV